ncbi:MAG: molybdopterin molybdenumtransferase MoeA [Rhodanobacteraceae bacterium]|nr:MAG: molybdopterin molybdenumtransferase MoeA [Rhodanobacteraceae bacterium]
MASTRSIISIRLKTSATTNARMTDSGYPTRIGLEQALEIVAACAAQHRLPPEASALAEAQGRVLAEDVHAPHPLPPFANSAMDGFALRGANLPTDGERAFELIGDVFAGATAAPAVEPGQCVRITTGAPMPPGTDTVVIKENVVVDGTRVVVKLGEKAGTNVRRAGEDYAEGDLALMAGTPLGAAQLAVVSAFGIAQIQARRAPRIAVIATGNELVPAGTPLGFGQIHESNAVMLAALARDSGMRVTLQRCVRDDPDALRVALLEAAAEADIIVSSGGVSAGEADHLPRVLQTIGETRFHKVRLKPGMPTLFGQIGACLYFGLPGNPVASAVTFRVFVRFAARSMLGVTTVPKPPRARLAAPVHKRHARAEFARCCLHVDDAGVQWAMPHAKQGSGMLRGLAETDALALLPEGAREFAAGDVVMLWP